MNTAQLIAWIYRVMLILQPANVTPWADTYETTATVFANEAIRLPLFPGSQGIERTAAVFTSVAWYEGRFDPKAKGDCKEKKNGKCVSPPQSVCMFQIGISNLAGLHTTQDELLSDVSKCTQAARTMMQISFGVCRALPHEDLLGHYASGGSTCGGLRESRHRMKTAIWIFEQRGK
jgi:hypothetical protein